MTAIKLEAGTCQYWDWILVLLLTESVQGASDFRLTQALTTNLDKQLNMEYLHVPAVTPNPKPQCHDASHKKCETKVKHSPTHSLYSPDTARDCNVYKALSEAIYHLCLIDCPVCGCSLVVTGDKSVNSLR